MRHNSHWLVLALGIAVACALWLAWVNGAVNWAHSALLQQSQGPAPAASSPSGASTDARERYFTERGQTGDAFGGLNAFLTALAGALVAWAGFMQHQLLKKTRETAEEEKHHRDLLQFESLFFRLLSLSAEVTARIEGPPRRGRPVVTVPGEGTHYERLPGPTGARALDSYAQVIYNAVPALPLDGPPALEGLEKLVNTFLTRVYDRRPSAFGPYFRLLFQTFKHVADSGLPEKEQIRYANIARGQISEGAVLLLALNGLSYEGYNFAPLIERFGLLEHLHRRYRTAYEKHLLLGYRPRAFLGSTDRALPTNAWKPKPVLPLDTFAKLEPVRADASEEADFSGAFKGESEIDP